MSEPGRKLILALERLRASHGIPVTEECVEGVIEAVRAEERAARASLEAALAQAGAVLEALNMAGGTGLTAEIESAVGITRRALAGASTPAEGEQG